MPRVRLLLAVLTVGSLAAAAACGTSGYQFVENEEFGVFAKVPEGWAMYDEEDLRIGLTQLGQGGVSLERQIARMWFRGFDANNEPNVAATIAAFGSEPRGFVQIRVLTAVEREQLDVQALRGFDSLAVQSGANNDIDLRLDEPAEFDGGYHGLHTVFATAGAGGQLGIVDQTVVLDPTNTVLFTFVVACNSQCFDETHTDEIDTIVESWTIQEDGQ